MRPKPIVVDVTDMTHPRSFRRGDQVRRRATGERGMVVSSKNWGEATYVIWRGASRPVRVSFFLLEKVTPLEQLAEAAE